MDQQGNTTYNNKREQVYTPEEADVCLANGFKQGASWSSWGRAINLADQARLRETGLGSSKAWQVVFRAAARWIGIGPLELRPIDIGKPGNEQGIEGSATPQQHPELW